MNEKIANEVWKDLVIDGHETIYQISNLGRLCNKNTGKFLRPVLIAGYYYYGITYANKKRRVALHRMVAFAFVHNDDPKNKTQVHHKDGNKLNNDPSNLQWVSPAEHSLLTFDTNISTIHMLSEAEVRKVCSDIESGKYKTLSKIAKVNNLPVTTVERIYKRMTFSHISVEYDFSKFEHKGAHKNRKAYLDKLEEMIKRGVRRSSCIEWLMNTHGLDQKDAEYIHDRRRQVILKQNPNAIQKIRDDQKEKYTKLFLPIEELLLAGNDITDTIQIVLNTLAPDMAYTPVKDLVRQRARAIVEGKSSVKANLIGREYDVARVKQMMERRHRTNHVEKYIDLFVIVEKRILDGDKFMDIAYDLMSEFNLKKSTAKNVVEKRCKAIIDNKPYVLHIGFESEIKALKKKYKKYVEEQKEYKKTHPYED